MATKRREVNYMPKKKMRGDGEYRELKSFELHPDAVKALDRMAKQFKFFYGKKHLVTFGILLLEKTINEQEMKAGDDLETWFGI
jgi:hypothetical protein